MRSGQKLVYGIGINDYVGNMSIKGKALVSYKCWHAMIERCYSPILHIRRPTYIGCTVCDEWLYFSNFKKWYDENYREGFDLDKDILIEGNKIYSPETCRFVPQYINKILNKHCNHGGNLPCGISKNNNSYVARCRNGNGGRLEKYSSDISTLIGWYSETKTSVVREVATRALEAGEIQQDVFDALIARKF